MIKKPYKKSKIKVFKFTPKSLCAGSPEAGQGDMGNPKSAGDDYSKSSGGIDWDLYEDMMGDK